MNKHIIFGILWIAVIIVGVGLFIFNFKGTKHFKVLELSGKIITIIFNIIAFAMIFSGCYFSYQQFTYQPPKSDRVTKQLKQTIKDANRPSNAYNQKIKYTDYYQKSDAELLKHYSSKGKADLNALAGSSKETKSLLLHNVGRKITPGNSTTSLITTSGAKVNLLDGKERMLVFVDNSKYSINQIKLLTSGGDNSKVSNIDLVFIFPTLNGSDITNLKDTLNNYPVVDRDSMPNKAVMDIKYYAIHEYSVKVLPSYLTIDRNGVISNAGVGSIFANSNELNDFISKSFGSSSDRLYREIIK